MLSKNILEDADATKGTDREPRAGDGEIRLMGAPGDTKIIWNPDNADEVRAAKKTFDDLVGGKKFLAFRVDTSDGGKGRRITEFDPEVEKLIICPPMAGGR